MKPSRLPLVLGLLAAALAPAACGSAPAPHSQPLDGSEFAVQLSAGGSPMQDRLIFSDGIFESTVCTSAGFDKSTYSSRLVAGGTAFDVQCDSPAMGHNDWHGVVNGSHVEGTVVRTPKDGGAPIKSTFSGERTR